ncbi:MAG TPA: DinB family protein [Rhodothermales bacterium]
MNHAAFTELESEATRLFGGLTHTQFNWRPGPDRWSVAECIEHLNTIGYKLLPGIEEAIREGHRRGRTGSPPFRHGLLGGLFVRTNAPIPARKVKTLRVYVPTAGGNLDRDETLERFRTLQRELERQVRESDGLDLGRIRVASPAVRWARFNLATWFDATHAHEQRHLRQARAVTEEPAFPSAD